MGVFILIFIISQALYLGLSKLSYQTEKNLFQKTSTFFTGAESNPYLTNLTQKILKKNNEYDLSKLIQIKILCSQQKNAFALPGGKILITSTLLKTLHSENALATVIAHEIGHIKNRDHLQGFSWSGAWLIISFFLGANTNDFMAKWIQIGSRAYSREHEKNADSYAKKIILKTYGHLHGASEFFQNLLSEDREITFLSTHPSLKERLDFFKWEDKNQLIPLDKKVFDGKCFLEKNEKSK